MTHPQEVPAFPAGTPIDSVVQALRARFGPASITFVSGNFNILHVGHLRLLRYAAQAGGALVVGVNADATDGVTTPQEIRLQGVRAIRGVGAVVALTVPAETFIAALRPEIVIKGREHAAMVNPERAVTESYGGRLLFSSGEARFASMSLVEDDDATRWSSTIRKPLDYPQRNGFRISDLARIPQGFAGLKVVVIGDLIVDEYIDCDPLGMSQEDPTIVVTPVGSRRFIGGAGIVAAHARGLGAQVTYIAVTGADEPAAFARTSLAALGVAVDFFPDSTRPTTLKQRYRAWGKTLLRVSHLRQHAIELNDQRLIADALDSALAGADVVLLSDFNYGCLPQPLVEHVTSRARSSGVMVAADSQASSQLGDIGRFKGMALITPTEREARLALRDTESGLVVLAEQLRQAADAENVVVTLGAEGVLIHARDQDSGRFRTEKLPAFNALPKDVAGAGDSFFTTAALSLRLGVSIWQAAYLGSLAAACQVSRVGNTPLTAAELLAELAHPEPQSGRG